MGQVWKALDTASGELVALKRMRAPERSAERFLREASLLSRVAHPALVRHVADGIDGEAPWLAMEWIEGETLAARTTRSPLSLEETLALSRRIAGALAALHAEGIVHRDVKPSACDELEALIRHCESMGPNRVVMGWLTLALASRRAMRRVSDADALRAHFTSPDRIRADLAVVLLSVALIRAGRLDQAARELDAFTPSIASAASAREVQTARIALLSGEPEAALAHCEKAEALLGRAATPWTWEWLHGARVGALCDLGREAEAASAFEAALESLGLTLEAFPDEEVDRALAEHEALLDLRRLAVRLGMLERWDEVVRR